MEKSKQYITIVNENDILLGRRDRSVHWIGNKKFRSLIQEKHPQYYEAVENHKKDCVARSVIRTIEDRNGRFLQQVGGLSQEDRQKHKIPPEVEEVWVEADISTIVSKVKQAFRDHKASVRSQAEWVNRSSDSKSSNNQATSEVPANHFREQDESLVGSQTNITSQNESLSVAFSLALFKSDQQEQQQILNMIRHQVQVEQEARLEKQRLLSFLCGSAPTNATNTALLLPKNQIDVATGSTLVQNASDSNSRIFAALEADRSLRRIREAALLLRGGVQNTSFPNNQGLSGGLPSDILGQQRNRVLSGTANLLNVSTLQQPPLQQTTLLQQPLLQSNQNPLLLQPDTSRITASLQQIPWLEQLQSAIQGRNLQTWLSSLSETRRDDDVVSREMGSQRKRSMASDDSIEDQKPPSKKRY